VRTWQTIRTSALDRHVHQEPYATLVLSGSYEEAGDQGRFQVSAGDVVFHDRFEAHLDRFPATRVEVVNLRLTPHDSCTPGIARVVDPDLVVRVARKSHRDAIELLLSLAVRRAPHPADWPDELAAALLRDPSLRLSRWAQNNGVAPWAVSRGFAQVFGVSPEAFRARARARHALRSIENTQQSLAVVAAELGFSDQSHMTRSVQQLTGRGPRALRHAANGFKTAKPPSV
jgi:AraC-like DNA-binding protein